MKDLYSKKLSPGDTKPCSRCKEVKPVEQFHKDKYLSSGYKSHCGVCCSKDFKEWRGSNLEQVRKKDRVTHYVRKYGLTEEHALQLVENRTGECLICHEHSPLVVDHCHTTGDVRGLICSSCNSMLGYAKDNPTSLKNAIAYLESFYNE